MTKPTAYDRLTVASRALQGLLACQWRSTDPEINAEKAVAYADALLRELAKPAPNRVPPNYERPNMKRIQKIVYKSDSDRELISLTSAWQAELHKYFYTADELEELASIALAAVEEMRVAQCDPEPATA